MPHKQSTRLVSSVVWWSLKMILYCFLLALLAAIVGADPAPSLDFNYHSINDDIYERPVNFMASKKLPHSKDETIDVQGRMDPGIPYDFTKFQEYLNENGIDRGESPDHNRIKRRAKRRRNRGRKSHRAETAVPTEDIIMNITSEGPPVDLGETDARRSSKSKKRKQSKSKKKKLYEVYESKNKQYETNFVEMPKDLYQAHLRPGVIFRIHMSEAILKMQYRNYGEDKDESVIEADVEYLRLTRKVISDEITKFEDLKWLTSWFINRTQLVREHICNTRYYSVGVPPTMFTSTEEYMKQMCLFDSVYIDHIPYVIGEDGSLMAAVAPPVLHCDAATCTSVPFIDSLMFDERLPRTNVRTVTRCQASCRAHCRNDPDCLKRCSDRCLRAE